jgi:hypothetical protein
MANKRCFLNLNFGEVLREHRYINCVKWGQRIIDTSGISLDWWQFLTADYYPTASSPGSIKFQVYLPGSGTYVCRWKGTGSASGGSFSSPVNSSHTYNGFTWDGGGSNGSSVAKGRFTFTAPASLTSQVTITGTSMTDFVICRLDEEADLDAGKTYRKAFTDLLAALNPIGLRFMDSQDTNVNMLSNWADRPASTKLTLHTGQFLNPVGDNGSGVGVITGTNTYAAAAYSGMPGTYQHGEIVTGRVLNSNTSTTVTLDVGGRGAKTVYTHNYMASASQPQVPTTSGADKLGRLLSTIYSYSFIYDSYWDAWFFYGESAPVGHPIEDLVELCNVSGLPGWFCIPIYATDDFVTQFAQYLVAHYTPATVYFEYGNEIWNTANGFPNTTRVSKWGDVTFSGIGSGSFANSSGWYGYRMAQCAALIRNVFAAAGQSSKVKIILACWGTAGNNTTDITNYNENKRFQNASFAALRGANAPILSADIVAYGYYYQGQTLVGFQTGSSDDAEWTTIGSAALNAKTAADDYASGDPARMKSALDWCRDDFTTNCTFFQTNTVGSSGRMENYNTLAATYGKQVVLYETNHEFNAPSTAWAAGSPINDSTYGGQAGKLNDLIRAFLASPQYVQVVQQYQNYFFKRSQSLGMGLYGMCLADPWLTFPKLNPTTETTLGGDTTQTPYSNWAAWVLRNNGKRRIGVKT